MIDDVIDNLVKKEIPVEPDDPGEEVAADVEIISDGSAEDGPEQSSIPDELPILPLRDSVVFPGTVMPLKIIRDHVQPVLDAALAGSRIVCAVSQRHSKTDQPLLDDLHRVGTACAILKLIELEDGTETIIVQGISRVGIVRTKQITPFLVAEVQPRADVHEESTELDALVHTVRAGAKRAIELSPNVADEAMEVVDAITTPGGLADFLAANLALPLVQKQELLETFDIPARLRKVNKAVVRQVEMLEISHKIQNQVRGQMDQSQREYFLREQLKAIQSELGQVDARSAEIDKFETRIIEAKMPEPVEEQARRELERLATIPQASPEYTTAIDYLEWLTSLPWAISTEDRLDIKRAASILDDDHYGLDKIKKRILEFLAVRTLKPDGRGPILCFTGPPGVGKTSLGQSIARALGRKFIRISLGGVHDEADIRGHRRTYVGAMPGRITQEIRKAGANNPVFMLDEVDKLGTDFRGDPGSALLEVLDPAQNASFVDRYLDVPFDLSRVMFIATANYMDAIPGPLRDRMEVIELSGYTYREKLEIAKKYLVPRQLRDNGLEGEKVEFDDDALRAIIATYTREAGVRGLERKIGALCRARAAAIVRGSRRSGRVTARSLAKDLGPPIHESEVAETAVEPGVVTGLAFTPVGGEILFIEARRMPGRGQLQLTGQIGDVMRESAQAAFSVVRSRGDEWNIDAKMFSESDFHIHVPAGAIPKDGPSAGVAMFTALASLLMDISVDPATGMTGEITLRGAVLPVGGVRDKVLAAHRAGLTRIILPHRNLRDLLELPADVKKDIEFVAIKTLSQLVKITLGDQQKKETKKRKPRRKSKRRARV